MILAFLVVIIFASTMLVASYKDATTMTIPNWVSLALIAGFVVITPFLWQGLSVFGTHILVGLTFFAVGFAMFAFGWLGGGDAKLMAATAFWWQWPDAILYVFYTTLAGGVLAAILMLGRRFIPARVLTSSWTYQMFKDQKKMPYGLALSFGALATLPQSHIFMAALGL